MAWPTDPYTAGNWSVEVLTTDTKTTAKTVSVTDMDWANDFVVSKESNGSECVLTNVTGSALVSPEVVRFQRSNIDDIYKNIKVEVPNSARLPAKKGIRTYVELNLCLQATNSVSGEEYLIPFRGAMFLEMPTASLVTSDAVDYLLKRTISSLFKTGVVTDSLEVGLARGDLNPQT